MRPPPSSIRSRLSGSVVSFIVGFVVANVGLLVVPRPDTWLWLAAAIVMMGTGVGGVLFADTRRDLSIWALLGVELFVFFTVAPLLWVFSTATSTPGLVRETLWPSGADWSAFADVWAAGPVRTAIFNSLLIAGLATLLAMALAVPAAYVLVRRPGARWWYTVFVAALVMPTFVFAAPGAAQLQAFGVPTSRLAMSIPTLVIALPIAVWLTVRVFRRAPWSLLDSVRVDGASRRQQIRHFLVPHLGIDLAMISALVFFWTAGDYAMGAGLAPTDEQRTLPATLLALDDSRLIAAAGLWWLLPMILVFAVFSRRLIPLVGRS